MFQFLKTPNSLILSTETGFCVLKCSSNVPIFKSAENPYIIYRNGVFYLNVPVFQKIYILYGGFSGYVFFLEHPEHWNILRDLASDHNAWNVLILCFHLRFSGYVFRLFTKLWDLCFALRRLTVPPPLLRFALKG